MTSRNQTDIAFSGNYANLNGLNIYYEIYGQGAPLVLIHGGGSTIGSSFGRAIPLFAKNRQVIAVELQAHGRTGDRDADLSFEQDADDVATLLRHSKLRQADVFGFSNGATTTLQLAIRHPELIRKIILGSPLAKRSGVPEGFWDFMNQATLENMPEALKEAYRQVAPDPNGLQTMHDRDAKRMQQFTDIPDTLLQNIKAPTLIIIGDKDVITPAHALELQRLIDGVELAIIPGTHGAYIDEITTIQPSCKQSEFVVPMIERFLDKS